MDVRCLATCCIPPRFYAPHIEMYGRMYSAASKKLEFVQTNCENTAYCVLENVVGSNWQSMTTQVEWKSGMLPNDDNVWLVDVSTEHYAIILCNMLLESVAFEHTLNVSPLNDATLCGWKNQAEDSFCVFEMRCQQTFYS